MPILNGVSGSVLPERDPHVSSHHPQHHPHQAQPSCTLHRAYEAQQLTASSAQATYHHSPSRHPQQLANEYVDTAQPRAAHHYPSQQHSIQPPYDDYQHAAQARPLPNGLTAPHHSAQPNASSSGSLSLGRDDSGSGSAKGGVPSHPTAHAASLAGMAGVRSSDPMSASVMRGASNGAHSGAAQGMASGSGGDLSSAAGSSSAGTSSALRSHGMLINAHGSASTSATSLAPPTTAASLMREGPRDFTVIKEVGDGSFGTVCLADWKSPLPSGTMLSPMQHPTTRPEYVGKRLVAIKKMKKPFPSWEECMKLKELKSLLAIPHHPNIIPLYDAFLMPGSKELHFVFECMEGNLYQLTKSRKGRPLAGGLVASIFQQIIRGLHHIHEHGYFHRDMKPENLLITTTGLADYPVGHASSTTQAPAIEKDVLVIVKLADFGLARETSSRPPYTEYVSTRWYRAPEVLLRSRDYSNPVDMWALGTILAELVNLKPLFPGQSEVDQVLQICDVLGDPATSYGVDDRRRTRGGGEWQRGVKMARSVGFQFPEVAPVTFASLFSSRVPRELVDCIQDLIRYDPVARLTTQHCLEHPYYTDIAPRLSPTQVKTAASIAAAQQAAQQQAQAQQQQAQAPKPQLQPLTLPNATARRDVPPSHSTQPQANKPPFGGKEGVHLQALPAVRLPPGMSEAQASNLQRVPFLPVRSNTEQAHRDVSMGVASPMREDPAGGSGDQMLSPGAEMHWVPSRDSRVSQYPAFPEDASLHSDSHQSLLQSPVQLRGPPQAQHQSQAGPSYVPGPESQVSASTIRDGSDPRHQQQQQQQWYAQGQQPQHQQQHHHHQQQSSTSGSTPRRTVYDDELSMAIDRQQHQQQFGAQPVSGQRPSLAQESVSTGSGGVESGVQVDRRRSKGGWGGKGLFGGKGAGSADLGAMDAQQPQSPQQPGAPTPAQQLAAEHSVPKDPKRAKKEAEKAAREAERAKRAAADKAARDRARAVMQKRNQILAASNKRDQVEWLQAGLVENDMTRALAQSEKARGKQPMAGAPAGMGVGQGSGQSQQGGSIDASGRSVPYSPASASSFGTQSYANSQSPASSGALAWQTRGTGAARLAAARRRVREELDGYGMAIGGGGGGMYGGPGGVSSFEMDSMDPRRQSMQSFQTGDSDPGPRQTGMPGLGQSAGYVQRKNSASSLSSAPSFIDAGGRRVVNSFESYGGGQAHDTRSLSSLEHQLEGLTAAEARQRTPGSASPAPAQLFGSRPSASRQSHGSRTSSAHRQGSASPLHHPVPPRFHPYGSSGVQTNIQLPPLPSIASGSGGGTPGPGSEYGAPPPLSGRPRSNTRRSSARGISRGSVTSNAATSDSAHFGPLSSPGLHSLTLVGTPGNGQRGGPGGGNNGGSSPMHGMIGGNGLSINPMFQVPKPNFNHGQPPDGNPTTLPPFSELLAAADVESDMHIAR